MRILVLVIVCVAVAALVAFLVMRNQKDKASLVKKLNADYRKPEDHEGDIIIDENIQ